MMRKINKNYNNKKLKIIHNYNTLLKTKFFIFFLLLIIVKIIKKKTESTQAVQDDNLLETSNTYS